MWKAGRQLSRIGAAGKVQRQSATLRAYHQAGEFDDALSAGGSGTGHGSQLAGVAQPVLPSDDAPGTEDSEGSDGPPLSHSFVLDVARGTRLRAVQKFGSHAGEPGHPDGV